MFLSDGGATSIAGIDTSGRGNLGSNIIGIFGQWGSTQLVLVVLYWILFFHDHAYMTLILGLLALEYLLRIVEGWIKPLETSSTPPGTIAAYIILPLSILFMVWSYSIFGKWLP